MQRHFLDSHLKLRVVLWGAADPVDTVVSLWGPGQRQVLLVDIFALSQRHVAHQQQPSAVRYAAQGIFQTGAAGAEDRFNMNIVSIHFNRQTPYTTLD